MGTMMPLPDDYQELFEFTDEDRDRARIITQEFGEHLTGGIEGSISYPAAKSIFSLIARSYSDEIEARDVASCLAIASQDLARYDVVGTAPAVITDGGKIPLSVSAFAGSTQGRGGYIASSFTDPSRIGDTMSRWVDQSPDRTLLRVPEATNQLISHLNDFLGVRIAGMRHWASTKIDAKLGHVSPAAGDDSAKPTNSPSGDGLFRVTVNCKAKDYRIFVSPAYFVDWLYFGYPSTPVVGRLMSGRYIFGTDAISPSIFGDSGLFQIPESFTPELKRF
jgi:hypothetical protein